ncbi:MAG TPA: hypothetical protein VFZ17_08240, partial [Acidimicrobiia bacterium]|nr:hypothetical protein [Acidimicrobiia bacterium]
GGFEMAILMRMDWTGLSTEQYDAVRKLVNWEGDQPPGGLAHVAAFDDGGMHVNDIWESREELDRFVGERLMPAVAQAGIESQPDVTVWEAHAVYIPGVTH